MATENSVAPEAGEAASPASNVSLTSVSTKDEESEQEMLKAVFNEEACATQLELISGCPPLERPLAAQFGTTRERQYTIIATSVEVKSLILHLIKEALVDQRSTIDALEMEFLMFSNMLAAGVAERGWLLQPIMADLGERDERLQKQQDCLDYWVEKTQWVEDAMRVDRTRLRQLSRRGDAQDSSDEGSTVGKQLQEQSVEECAQQEQSTQKEETASK